MKSIVRKKQGKNNSDRNTKQTERRTVRLEELYANISRGKECTDYYRNIHLIDRGNEYFLVEALGTGGQAFVFLAYNQRRLTALKMTEQKQKSSDVFSTIRRTAGEDYHNHLLGPAGQTSTIDGFYLGGLNETHRVLFDRQVYVSYWEPADATLSEKLEEPFETKRQWFIQFLKGLTVIHERNRIHFDIKLENLFLVDNQLKIGDFEFYYKADDFSRIGDFIMGTPGHIAPEMFYDRERISTRADIYSAGIAFLRLFNGVERKREPGMSQGGTKLEGKEIMERFGDPRARRFIEKSLFVKNYRIYRELISPIEARRGDKSGTKQEMEIERWLLKMIDIDPEKRPTASEILEALTADETVDSAVYVKIGQPAGIATDNRHPFYQMLNKQRRKDLIMYSLLPDLQERLEEENIKVKISGVTFTGDHYNKSNLNFQRLEPDAEKNLRLFGREYSNRSIRKYRDWNLLVIVEFWDRMYGEGLKNHGDIRHVEQLINERINGDQLEDVERRMYRPVVKATRQLIKKLIKKALKRSLK